MKKILYYYYVGLEEDRTLLEIVTNETNASARIIVVGVGGAGNNAVNRMIEEKIVGDRKSVV